tara:strand:+ start:54 stop:236 length:183 start_codon:yes stop_codon:yes gene_type:complete
MKDKNIKVINHVEKIRRLNNKNWMNLLRIAIKYAPKESKRVIKNINLNDKKISRLLSKIK